MALIAVLNLVIFSEAANAKRPIDVEDCVRTRRIVSANGDHTSLAMSPDERQVAYVVKEPNQNTNRNDYTLYVRQLRLKAIRENGRALAKHDRISGIVWLSDNKHITLLAKDGDRTYIEMVDTETGRAERLPVPGDIDSHSVDSTGRVYVFTSRVSRVTNEQRTREEQYGFPVLAGSVIDLDGSFPTYEPKFKVYVLTKSERGWNRKKELCLTSELRKQTKIFESVTGISLSPNGRYLAFSYVPSEIPSHWKENPLCKWLQSQGVKPWILVVYDLKTNQSRIAFDAPSAFPTRTVWSGDSRAFSVVSIAPTGSAWEKRDLELGFTGGARWASYSHLYTVNVVTSQISESLFHLPNPYENEIALWKREEGPILVRSDSNTFIWLGVDGKSWKARSQFRVSLPETNLNSGWSTNGQFLIGLREGVSTPPDLVLYDVEKSRTDVLTDLNPEMRNIELGVVESIEWHDAGGQPCAGFLIKPIGYTPGHRYPLVVMSKGWVSNFFYTDTFHRTAFAPQPLAAAGFVVLLATRPDYFESGRSERVTQYPGHLGEVYNWMAMIESGVALLDQRGIVDKKLVGIIGFSRTSWYVDFMLTHSEFKFAAASSADSGLYNYGGYWVWNARGIEEESETEMGGAPYGETLENWLKYAPAFNASRVSAPLLMEYTKETSFGPVAAYEFFTALHRQGKPVELFYYPRGEHELDTPRERVASLRRNVDWFRFWMQDYQGHPPSYDPNQYLRWRELHDQFAKTPMNNSVGPATGNN